MNYPGSPSGWDPTRAADGTPIGAIYAMRRQQATPRPPPIPMTEEEVQRAAAQAAAEAESRKRAQIAFEREVESLLAIEDPTERLLVAVCRAQAMARGQELLAAARPDIWKMPTTHYNYATSQSYGIEDRSWDNGEVMRWFGAKAEAAGIPKDGWVRRRFARERRWRKTPAYFCREVPAWVLTTPGVDDVYVTPDGAWTGSGGTPLSGWSAWVAVTSGHLRCIAQKLGLS